MVQTFVAKPLKNDRAALAYPLIRLLEPSTELQDWLFVADRLCKSNPARRGCIVVVDAAGYIHGIYCYDIEQETGGGIVLDVNRMIVVDNALCPGAALALIRSLESLAHRLSCRQIDIALPKGWIEPTRLPNSLCNLLERSGYRRHTVGLVKPIGTARSSARE